MTGYLLLEDGTLFTGAATRETGGVFGEIYFHTDMAGFENTFTDPANAGQFMVMTYPLIGNYGFKKADLPEGKGGPSVVIAKAFSSQPSHFEKEMDIYEFFDKAGIIGLSHIDTRQVAKGIRDKGSMKAMVKTAPPTAADLDRLQAYQPQNHLGELTVKEPVYEDHGGAFNVGVVDLGAAKALLEQLRKFSVNIHILPYNTSGETLLALDFTCIFCSQGGSRWDFYKETIQALQKVVGKKQIYGIGMGAIVLASALDCDIYKLPNGHRGGNYPVRELATGTVLMTEQNIGYGLVPEALGGHIRPAYININDGAIDGFEAGLSRGVLFNLSGNQNENGQNPLLATWLEGCKDAKK